jgi:uncharacterized phage protein gp47/JayE
VTRAWCLPHVDGAGTVAIYIMLDIAQAVNGGFPQGNNGRAVGEPRGVAATGDQLAVADAIYPLQPVTALVNVRAPTPNVVNITIEGMASASTQTKNAVAAAIRQALLDQGSVGATPTTVSMSYLVSAIAALPNTTGFVITAPAGNIVSPAGALPTLGTITWAV